MKRKPMMNQIKTKVQIQNKVDSTETDLILYGDVGESYWGDGITASSVRYALKQITTDVVNVHINSYGGDVFEGLAIYNVFKQSDKTINTIIDGVAASAASIIFMGGNKRLMPKNTQLMIHNAQTGVWGYAEDFEKAIAALNSIKVSLIASYMEKFEGTEEELINYLANETFFTAEEAVGCGLADEILNYEATIVEDLVDPVINILDGKIAAKAKQKNEDELPATEKKENPIQNFVKLLGGK